jgi:hypothetical protein
MHPKADNQEWSCGGYPRYLENWFVCVFKMLSLVLLNATFLTSPTAGTRIISGTIQDEYNSRLGNCKPLRWAVSLLSHTFHSLCFVVIFSCVGLFFCALVQWNLWVWISSLQNGGGTWPSGQRGALASWRSQRIPAVAVNLLSVLICCWLREVVVHECSMSLPVCCVTRVTTLCSQHLEPPERAG